MNGGGRWYIVLEVNFKILFFILRYGVIGNKVLNKVIIWFKVNIKRIFLSIMLKLMEGGGKDIIGVRIGGDGDIWIIV